MRKIECIMQCDSMECGMACFQIICKYYWKRVSSAFLSKVVSVSKNGASLLAIYDVANKIGFRTIGGRVGIKALSSSVLPCILHWNQNHFVVLYKVWNGKKFYVADPVKGLVKYNLEEFKSHWISTKFYGEEKGIAMFLEPTPAFYSNKADGDKSEKRKEDNPRSFRFLFGYVRKYKKYFGQIILGLVVGSMLQLVLPFLTQSIVDVGIKNQDIGFIT